MLRIIKRYIHLQTLEQQETDFKSRLIEWSQKNKTEINFEFQEESPGGSSHPVFVADIVINGKLVGRGKGQSKKDAEQKAAEQALNNIGDESGR